MNQKQLYNKRNNKKNRRNARHERWFEKHGAHHPSVRRSKHGLKKSVSPLHTYIMMARERGMKKVDRVVTKRVSSTPEQRAETERLEKMRAARFKGLVETLGALVNRVDTSDLIGLLEKATDKVKNHAI